MALERGYSTSPDLGGFDHSNIVEDHVQRLEQLATVPSTHPLCQALMRKRLRCPAPRCHVQSDIMTCC